MVVPRRWPEFPGRRLGLFTLAVLILFAGMLTAVVTATGGEEHGEAEHAPATEGGSTEAETGASTTESTETESTETETESTETESTGTGETETGETGETETEGESTETSGGGGAGNAQAGAAVFASAGCTGCHTLAAANAAGNVGPNLDEAKPSAELVVDRVTNGKGVMPSFKGQLTDQQIQDVAAYVSENAGK
jgi:cytochrome c553